MIGNLQTGKVGQRKSVQVDSFTAIHSSSSGQVNPSHGLSHLQVGQPSSSILKPYSQTAAQSSRSQVMLFESMLRPLVRVRAKTK